MADEREVFSILEDVTTGEGHGLTKREKGDTYAAGDNEAPVLPAEDLAGTYQHLPIRDPGDDALVGVPVLICKDPSGDLRYANCDAQGNIGVNPGGTGLPKQATGKVTPGALDTDVDVAVLTMTALKLYKDIEWRGSSFQPCSWQLVHDDNGTPTVIDEGFITGSGQFSFEVNLMGLEVTAGAAGVQELKIVSQQERGKLSDMRGTLTCDEF